MIVWGIVAINDGILSIVLENVRLINELSIHIQMFSRLKIRNNDTYYYGTIQCFKPTMTQFHHRKQNNLKYKINNIIILIRRKNKRRFSQTNASFLVSLK